MMMITAMMVACFINISIYNFYESKAAANLPKYNFNDIIQYRFGQDLAP